MSGLTAPSGPDWKLAYERPLREVFHEYAIRAICASWLRGPMRTDWPDGTMRITMWDDGVIRETFNGHEYEYRVYCVNPLEEVPID